MVLHPILASVPYHFRIKRGLEKFPSDSKSGGWPWELRLYLIRKRLFLHAEGTRVNLQGHTNEMWH